MDMKRLAQTGLTVAILCFLGCSKPSEQVSELRHFPIDSLEEIITKSDVQIDSSISSDGNGSLLVTAKEPMVVRLLEVSDIRIEQARFIYQAKLRTRDLNGQAYLEMWCHFPGKGEFFSRSLQTPLSGTQDWTTVETTFFLQKGESPDLIKLNLGVDGKGSVWIDDIHLIKGPLR